MGQDEASGGGRAAKGDDARPLVAEQLRAYATSRDPRSRSRAASPAVTEDGEDARIRIRALADLAVIVFVLLV